MGSVRSLLELASPNPHVVLGITGVIPVVSSEPTARVLVALASVPEGSISFASGGPQMSSMQRREAVQSLSDLLAQPGCVIVHQQVGAGEIGKLKTGSIWQAGRQIGVVRADTIAKGFYLGRSAERPEVQGAADYLQFLQQDGRVIARSTQGTPAPNAIRGRWVTPARLWRKRATQRVFVPDALLFQAFYALHTGLASSLLSMPWDSVERSFVSFETQPSGFTTGMTSTETPVLVLKTKFLKSKVSLEVFAHLVLDPMSRDVARSIFGRISSTRVPAAGTLVGELRVDPPFRYPVKVKWCNVVCFASENGTHIPLAVALNGWDFRSAFKQRVHVTSVSQRRRKAQLLADRPTYINRTSQDASSQTDPPVNDRAAASNRLAGKTTVTETMQVIGGAGVKWFEPDLLTDIGGPVLSVLSPRLPVAASGVPAARGQSRADAQPYFDQSDAATKEPKIDVPCPEFDAVFAALQTEEVRALGLTASCVEAPSKSEVLRTTSFPEFGQSRRGLRPTWRFLPLIDEERRRGLWGAIHPNHPQGRGRDVLVLRLEIGSHAGYWVHYEARREDTQSWIWLVTGEPDMDHIGSVLSLLAWNSALRSRQQTDLPPKVIRLSATSPNEGAPEADPLFTAARKLKAMLRKPRARKGERSVSPVRTRNA